MTDTFADSIAAPDSEFSKNIRRFQLLSIATKEGIWEHDFITKQSFYNEGMIELFGYTHDEMADNETWWRNNIHPQDKKRVITELDEMMAGNKTVWWGKYQFRCKDGSYKLILDRLFLVRDANQQSLRMIGTMQDLTEIDALQKELENIRKEQHHAMMKAIFQAEENERNNISYELNENINQVLAAINIHLAQAKSQVTSAGKIWLQEAQALLLDSISGVRAVAKRLSPVILKDLGLSDAFRELMERLEDNRNIDSSLSIDEKAVARLNNDLQTLLYRMAEEQVTNIARHSNATVAHLTIESYGAKIKMTVLDNGTGINLKQIQFGRGFSSIQEKTDAFGGSFSLESAEGKPGFKLEVIL
ncbi:MAG TPA: PAS domain-containing protein [Ferruginibacter sp.]|nr:PAS domain-containing protein [Ferruginibacter sp.]HMP19949.1 PAS domain-containing protein [Ferruginibacter sp.]